VDPRHDRRIAYVFVAAQLLLLVVIFVLPGGDDWHTPPWAFTAAGGLQLIGLAALGIALFNLGRSLTPLPLPVSDGRLREGGLYRFVRHPIYAGIIALTIGGAIRSQSLAVAATTLALAVLLTVKARWEERRLLERYPAYAGYAARTPRFVPFTKLRGRGRPPSA
jgi:protein-S-isoprenylcysteine O-methyltransferase Ste14